MWLCGIFITSLPERFNSYLYTPPLSNCLRLSVHQNSRTREYHMILLKPESNTKLSYNPLICISTYQNELIRFCRLTSSFLDVKSYKLTLAVLLSSSIVFFDISADNAHLTRSAIYCSHLFLISIGLLRITNHILFTWWHSVK